MNNITRAATAAVIQTIDLDSPTLGVQIVASTFALGANTGEFSPLATVLPGGIVYNGVAGQMEALQASDNTIIYRVTLDESVGDFSYGSIGLYLPSGVLLAWTPLAEIRSKFKTDYPDTYGNFHSYRIPVSIAPFDSNTPTSPPQVIYDPGMANRLKAYLKTETPSASASGEGACIYVKNAAGGARPFWSNGVNWLDAASSPLS